MNSNFMVYRLVMMIFYFIWGITAHAQEVETLKPGQTPGAGQLTDLAWLAGYWKGNGMGGECEELWMPKSDNGMHGIFRLQKEGKLVFTEYMVLEEKEGSLTVKIKHFGGGINPWEDKEQWTTFPLIRIDGQSVFFDGLTFKRTGENLVIHVSMESGDKVSIETFYMKKAVL